MVVILGRSVVADVTNVGFTGTNIGLDTGGGTNVGFDTGGGTNGSGGKDLPGTS